MARAAVVFVHGLFSSPRTWDSLVDLVRADPEIAGIYDCAPFGYSSPKWSFRPDRRVPDFETIAASLRTFLEVECASYSSIVLVGHSQGGLIIQRFLQRMLADGRAIELSRLRRIVLIACPNNGSELLLSIRKGARFWHHVQEQSLRPLNEAAIDCLRIILQNIVYAQALSRDKCPIPFSVYAGETDNIVTRASANSVFPEVGVLPGDHNSILHAYTSEHRTYSALKYNLLRALTVSNQALATRRRQANELDPASDITPHDAQPLLRTVKTVVDHNQVIETQVLEIFDEETRNLWIARDPGAGPGGGV